MKLTLAILLIAILALPGRAGEPIAVEPGPTPQPTPYFRDHEFDLGLFGLWATSPSPEDNRAFGDHAFGGGIQAFYFPTRYLGFGLEGEAFHGSPFDETKGIFSANVVARYPFEALHFAPYIAMGIGGYVGDSGDTRSRDSSNDDLLFEGHVGIGLEFRFTPNFGVFTDSRYFWIERDHNDFPQVRAGFNFSF